MENYYHDKSYLTYYHDRFYSTCHDSRCHFTWIFSGGHYDIIYAQTVVQLDGDVISRYHEKLFEDEDAKELILMNQGDR